MLAPSLTDLAANAAADAVLRYLDGGYLRMYSGTKPATADTPITDQVLLAELRWNPKAFLPASTGVSAANPITADPSAAETEKVTWFRAFRSDGVTAVFDGTVGTKNANLILGSVAISAGTIVSVSEFAYAQAKG